MEARGSINLSAKITLTHQNALYILKMTKKVLINKSGRCGSLLFALRLISTLQSNPGNSGTS